jgi:poly(hydroxyalkanoate) depolymerase family esterase
LPKLDYVAMQHSVCAMQHLRVTMSGLGSTVAKLAKLRRRFEQLLAAARKRSRVEPPVLEGRLQEVSGFGSNPGNLRMMTYVPKRLPRSPPLVVALHGCTQTAPHYDHGTGWSTLADRHQLVVLYPQQQISNNPSNCFSWFLPGDVSREEGEALSIRQMVERAVRDHSIDRRRIFVTGLSAGGAMASAMLATYPEVFAGGAIIAGLPYGCATSVEGAFKAMFEERSISAGALGNRVRAASQHKGPWPRVSVWHGLADTVVNPINAEEIIRQWAYLHGLSARPTFEDTIAGHSRCVWNDINGDAVIEAFFIANMSHGVPLATDVGSEQCGVVGPFFLDVGISSTEQIARFWGLAEEKDEARELNTASVFARAPEPFLRDETIAPQWPFVPNGEIVAAFKAAGLPVPNIADPSKTHIQPIDPGKIIEAALKAAGLLRR